MGFEHYKYTDKPSGRTTSLAEIIAAGRAKEAAADAERERVSRLCHKARMEQFRAWVYRQDYLTAEDKAEMIKASFTW